MNMRMLELAKELKEECFGTRCHDCPLKRDTSDCGIALEGVEWTIPQHWTLPEGPAPESTLLPPGTPDPRD